MQTLAPDDFVEAAYPVTLAADEIQLWFLPHAGRSDSAVRDLLSSYLRCAPDAVPLRRSEFGKPYLDVTGDTPATFEFNVTHSKQALLVGISRFQPLGVDIEARGRVRPARALAERFFAPSEARALREVTQLDRQRALLSLWSCKEAVVKALGRGIGFGLARLAFALDGSGRPMRLNVIDASAGAVREWHIVLLQPDADHGGAVAWRGPARPVRAFRAGTR